MQKKNNVLLTWAGTDNPQYYFTDASYESLKQSIADAEKGFTDDQIVAQSATNKGMKACYRTGLYSV